MVGDVGDGWSCERVVVGRRRRGGARGNGRFCPRRQNWVGWGGRRVDASHHFTRVKVSARPLLLLLLRFP